MSAMDGSAPALSSRAVAATIAARVRRRWAARPGPGSPFTSPAPDKGVTTAQACPDETPIHELHSFEIKPQACIGGGRPAMSVTLINLFDVPAGLDDEFQQL